MIDLNSMEFLVIHLNFYKKIYACRHTKSKITEDPFLFLCYYSFKFLVCIHLQHLWGGSKVIPRLVRVHIPELVGADGIRRIADNQERFY